MLGSVLFNVEAERPLFLKHSLLGDLTTEAEGDDEDTDDDFLPEQGIQEAGKFPLGMSPCAENN